MTNQRYEQQASAKIAALIHQHKFSARDLQQAYARLSQRYHQKSYKPGFADTAETLAYLVARLPATYATVQRVLQEFPADFQPQSLLDYGCGPGTATLACLDHFLNVESLTLVDQSAQILNLAQQLIPPALKPTFLNNDSCLTSQSHDLVIASYMLNELAVANQRKLLEKLLDACRHTLIIIMPGTPKCYAELMELRTIALRAGFHILAPCPHHLACPMAGTTDWCHFSIRLPRTKQHQSLKGASLNFEDEKFSYLILSREPSTTLTFSRVVKNPQHRSGHSLIDLCHDGKLERRTYSKSDGDHYKIAKNLEWGMKFKE